jgi:hypothetical protein
MLCVGLLFGDLEAPCGVHLWGVEEFFLCFGIDGAEEMGPGGEFGDVRFGFAVDDKALVCEEFGGGFEVAEFFFFDVVLLEELTEVVRAIDEGGVDVFLDVDIGGDPVTAAALQGVADIAAELGFFGFVEVDEKAFVEDQNGAGWESVDDGVKGGGVEGVEGGE